MLLDDLWTAPELLRRPIIAQQAIDVLMLRKADIYSLGIILHEVYGRQGTWGESLLEPSGELKFVFEKHSFPTSDIVERVKFSKEQGRYFRPDMDAVRSAPPQAKGVTI